MDELTSVDWGLQTSRPPVWVSAIDWARRRLGYRLRGGERLNSLLGRWLPPTLDTEIVPGISARVDLRQEVARATWWSGRGYEAPTPTVLSRWLVGGAERFFDVGANYGWFSYMALSCSSVDVYAFEPRPDLFQQLQAAKSVNELDRFHPNQLGLSDRPGELRLRVHDSQTGYSTFGPHPNMQLEGDLAMVVDFDTWREEAGLELPPSPLWVAKIDVEGFETKVLQGMTNSLRAQAFAGVVVEMNAYTLDFCGSSIAEVEALMGSAGYKMLYVKGQERTINRFFVPDL